MAHPAPAALRDEVLAGLRATPKSLPAKLLYDARGAQLFEAITRLDAYYLTRAETEILDARAGEIASLIGAGRVILEYGSGETTKARRILEQFPSDARPAAFVPIDTSREQLHRAAARLASEFADVPVIPAEADYTAPFEIPTLPPGAPASGHVALFLGSTIGNFHEPEAVELLRRIARQCGEGGALLLGADLRKDPLVLHEAYNDPAGVTADFNRNLLVRMNREFDAMFDADAFRHYACYNPTAGRIEMHLVSLRSQCIRVGSEWIWFENGESIWTESSYKYTWSELRRITASAGFTVERRWTDARSWFALLYLAAHPDGGT